MDKTSNRTKGRMGQNIEWKKNRMEKTPLKAGRHFKDGLYTMYSCKPLCQGERFDAILLAKSSHVQPSEISFILEFNIRDAH
jgi:hypothetical protein